jgi:ribosomal-protein-alanine N-acetyltransferase
MIYQLRNGYYVRTLQQSDLDGPYISWFEDQDVSTYNSHGKFFKTKDYFSSYVAEQDKEEQLVWAICHKDDGHIGNISLQLISFINRNADFGVLIGDKRHWGKGVALQAGMKMLYHGFFKLNLKRVYCQTAASNVPMQNLAKNLGMIQEGCRRSNLYLEGKWVDMIEYGILKNEFDLRLINS